MGNHMRQGQRFRQRTGRQKTGLPVRGMSIGTTLRAVWTIWLLGMWVSLPGLRLEAALVFDPAHARVSMQSNTIRAVKGKAEIAARVGTAKAEIGQKEAYHQHSRIQDFTRHVDEFNRKLQEYTQQVRTLMTQGRELVTLNGSLRTALGLFDEGTRILAIKRDIADVLRVARDISDIREDGFGLVLDGYNLIAEIRQGARGLNPAELVRTWEEAALDNEAIHIYQSQNFIRTLRIYLPEMEWHAQKYAQYGARLIELKKRLELLEKELDRARQRPVSQKQSPGDIEHVPVGDREPGIPDPAQLPETGPSSPLPREETAAGIDALTRNYHRTRDLIAETERAMLKVLDESRETAAMAAERFEAALRAQLEQDTVEAGIIQAWLDTKASARSLLEGWLGDAADFPEEEDLNWFWD